MGHDSERFLRQLVELSMHFAELASEELGPAVERALALVGEQLGADCCEIEELPEDATLPAFRAASVAGVEDRLPQLGHQADFPWLAAQLARGRTVVVPRCQDLPENAIQERTFFERAGLESAAFAPMGAEGRCQGVLKLGVWKGHRDWGEDDVARLCLAAEVLCHGLVHRRADEAARQAEFRYRTVADFAYNWEYWLGPQGELLYVSPSAQRVTGHTADELSREPTLLDRIVLEEDSEAWQRHRHGQRPSSGRLEIELRIRHKNGEVRWIEHACQTVTGPRGEPYGVRASNRDVTPRKQAEEELTRSQLALTEAQRIAHLGSWSWDIVTNELSWSDEVYRIFGLAPQQFGATYEAFLSSVHPDDRAAVMAAVDRAVADPASTYEIEHRVVRPDSQERLVLERGEVTFGTDDKPLRMIGTVHDITELKRTQQALERALQELRKLKDRLEAENVYLRQEARQRIASQEIIGDSDVVKAMLEQAGRVAPTDSVVLITGETGTGKELLAQAIHDQSRRRERAMVKVNCAALPSTLIESELFGREKGAYTGAMTRQAGRFEAADGSTIFLDEVGELPLDLQGKLLRVLQEGELERLGSSRTIRVDVRVIAASNRDLAALVKAGRFRADLYYRLDVFPIQVPPLRERGEDIPILVWRFLRHFATKMGKTIDAIPRKAMEELQRYAWPGNVRELRNLVEHAVIMTDGPTLRIELRSTVASDQQEPIALEEVERQHLLRVLERTGWRVSGAGGAAALLGLKPTTLHSRLKKLGISRPAR